MEEEIDAAGQRIDDALDDIALNLQASGSLLLAPTPFTTAAAPDAFAATAAGAAAPAGENRGNASTEVRSQNLPIAGT
jgi:hypothetical protein